MFKKLVSSLPFSPALVGQLGFYAKRLKKEEATRKLGLIFTALALVVQSFAVFQAPEAANAASANDFISGGFTTREQYLSNYDANTGNLRDLFNVLGISRSNIANSTYGQWNSHSDGGYSWGHLTRFSYAQGERSYTIPTSNGGSTTFYYRPLYLSDTLAYTKQYGSTYEALIGKTASGMQFALLKICGNLVLKVTPPPVPCPSDSDGTYPNCVKKTCPAGTNGTYPNCVKLTCPTGTVGTYPDCVKQTCPAGTSGTYPNCVKLTCPAGTVGTYPDCVKQTASCDLLKIDRILTNYQFTTTAPVSGGVTVKNYTYTIKRDGKVIDTKVIQSTQQSNIYTYSQTIEGTYTVEVSVDTSLGPQTSPACAGTFYIAPPEKCPQHPSILLINPECQPCPGDSTMWIKDTKCVAELVQTKTATNTSQGNVNATTVTAKANDKIVYSLNVENKGKAPIDTVIIERIDDVAEYANVIDGGGSTKGQDPDTKTAILTWPKVTLKPGEKVTRMFTVQVMSSIPAMNKGSSDPTSYDCRMMNTFGNNVTIAVDCPIQKQIVENVTAELPHTGPTENAVISASAFAVIAFFYARSRQLKTEVRLIRRDFNAGTI